MKPEELWCRCFCNINVLYMIEFSIEFAKKKKLKILAFFFVWTPQNVVVCTEM